MILRASARGTEVSARIDERNDRVFEQVGSALTVEDLTDFARLFRAFNDQADSVDGSTAGDQSRSDSKETGR